jgi:sterol 3beta-glucosyltransferase
MKIGLQTWGSDGDILPFMALADGLSSAGHEVTVAYTSVDNKDYSQMGKAMNIKLIKAVENFEIETDGAIYDIMKTYDLLKELRLMLEMYFDPVVEEMYEASKTLCIKNDIVIGHVINHTLVTAAEKYNCPRVSLAFFPIAIPTKYVSPIGVSMGKWLNSLIWSFGDYIAGKKLFQSARELREKEGLPPIKSLQKELYTSEELTLLATSRELCQRQPDWGDNIEICGPLKPPKNDAQSEIPKDLHTFLDAGVPPVYITFGSCTQFDLENTTRLFIEAAKLSGNRAIIQSEWDKLSLNNDDPNIYKVNKIPHDQIFPHCSMIVHHGGAGTTQSALIAGKPSLVVAHAFDQPFWGKQLQRLGVAGKPLHRRSVTADKIARGIKKILSSPKILENSKSMGQTMKKENGVSRAIEAIEKRFNPN